MCGRGLGYKVIRILLGHSSLSEGGVPVCLSITIAVFDRFPPVILGTDFTRHGHSCAVSISFSTISAVVFRLCVALQPSSYHLKMADPLRHTISRVHGEYGAEAFRVG